jgi:hypothetical protein
VGFAHEKVAIDDEWFSLPGFRAVRTEVSEMRAVKDTFPNIFSAFFALLIFAMAPVAAGSPTDENVRWTDLKPLQLAEEFGPSWVRDWPQQRRQAPGSGGVSAPLPAQGTDHRPC